MTEQAVDREFSWDDEIEKDSEFVLLPPGDYDFTVADFERGRFSGSEKLPPCPSAKVQLQIKKDGETATVFHKLYLHSRTEWGLTQFFTAIGQKKKGEKLTMDWSKVPGATGRAKISVREYDGREFNEVKKFYPKDQAPAAGASADSWN